MAVNFRLSHNNGFEYVDLFPKTDISCIIDSANIMSYSKKTVNIPSTRNVLQVIPLTLTEKQKKSVFYVDLVHTDTRTARDYATITNIAIVGNNLEIYRQGPFPIGSIDIELTFIEEGL